MADYIMALDAGTTSSRCIRLIKKGRSAVLPRKNLPSIFQNQAGWNMMQMKSGQASLELR